jgi:uncharacterized membrane protein
MAPLQKRALYSFLIGLVMAIALAVVFIIKDVTTFDEDKGFRFIVYALWIGVPLVYLILMSITIRKPSQVDERDRRIMDKAPYTQVLAIIFSLVIWVIALTETYQVEREVPLIFISLIMISTLIVSTLAQSLGILIGYWRS